MYTLVSGCILAELHTGYPLFPGENESEQLACIMELLGPPPPDLLLHATRKRLFFGKFNFGPTTFPWWTPNWKLFFWFANINCLHEINVGPKVKPWGTLTFATYTVDIQTNIEIVLSLIYVNLLLDIESAMCRLHIIINSIKSMSDSVKRSNLCQIVHQTQKAHRATSPTRRVASGALGPGRWPPSCGQTTQPSCTSCTDVLSKSFIISLKLYQFM